MLVIFCAKRFLIIRNIANSSFQVEMYAPETDAGYYYYVYCYHGIIPKEKSTIKQALNIRTAAAVEPHIGSSARVFIYRPIEHDTNGHCPASLRTKNQETGRDGAPYRTPQKRGLLQICGLPDEACLPVSLARNWIDRQQRCAHSERAAVL